MHPNAWYCQKPNTMHDVCVFESVGGGAFRFLYVCVIVYKMCVRVSAWAPIHVLDCVSLWLCACMCVCVWVSVCLFSCFSFSVVVRVFQFACVCLFVFIFLPFCVFALVCGCLGSFLFVCGCWVVWLTIELDWWPGWLADLSFIRLIDWLIYVIGFSDWLIYWLIDWVMWLIILIDCLVILIDWQFASMTAYKMKAFITWSLICEYDSC